MATPFNSRAIEDVHGLVIDWCAKHPEPLVDEQQINDLLATVAYHSRDALQALSVELLRPNADPRCYLTPGTQALSAMLIAWKPGHQQRFHDHGNSIGGARVVAGSMEEIESSGHGPLPMKEGQVIPFNPRSHVRSKGKTTFFPQNHVHRFRNASRSLAITLHAYAPVLQERQYQIRDDALQLLSATPKQFTVPTGERKLVF